MNERSGIYRESFHLKLSLKIGLLPLKSSKKHLWPAFPMLGGAWLGYLNFIPTFMGIFYFHGAQVYFLTLGCLARTCIGA